MTEIDRDETSEETIHNLRIICKCKQEEIERLQQRVAELERVELNEKEITRLRAALADIADSSSVTATAVQMVRTLQSMAREAL